jgi:hypothetical protein
MELDDPLSTLFLSSANLKIRQTQELHSNLEMLELVKFSSLSTPFKAIGAMLTSFSHTALPARGVSKRMLQWLDGAR